MNSYLVMIYGDEDIWESWTEEHASANAAAHALFHEQHGAAVVGGYELDRSRTGRSVRSDGDGGQVVTEGSFLGGRTVIGGYYVIQAPDLDHAVRIAADLPEASAPASGVEVRPLASP
jgi:hypothetical protein